MGQLSLAVKPAGTSQQPAAPVWRRAELLVPCGYLLAALAVTWGIDANPALRVPANYYGRVESDIYLNVWFMRYAATAVAHGHLPALVTTAVNAPQGINLMWNTSMLLPGIVLAPVTLLAGPAASLAVLLVVGFAGSAASLYFVLRRWGASIAAAAIGGAVYGFSPAIMVAAQDHYHLEFAVLPPLILDAALRLATGRGHPVRTGAWLGLLVSAQVFTAEELLVDTGLIGVALLVVLVASRPRQVRDRLLGAAAGGSIALLLTLLICGHALYVQFHGPLAERGSPWHVGRYWIDPVDFVTAPSAMVLHGNFARFLASTGQWSVETFAYLGWPLLLVVVAAVIAFWRDLRIRMAGIAFAVMEWLGVGNHRVTVDGWNYPVKLLPWHWLAQVHVLNQVLPNRFPILADGAAAVVLALSFDHVRALAPARRPWGAVAAAAAVALVLVPIIPRPVPSARVLPAPSGWSAVLHGLHLRSGASVLVLPYETAMTDRANPMEWQAMTDTQVSLVGGYCIVPNPSGHAVMCNTTSTLDVDQHLSVMQLNWLALREPGRAGPARPVLAAAIAAWRPAAVVTADGGRTRLGRYLIQFFGPPTARRGSMLGWRIEPGEAAALAGR